MPTLKGIWSFKDVLSYSSVQQKDLRFKVLNVSTQFYGIWFNYSEAMRDNVLLYLQDTSDGGKGWSGVYSPSYDLIWENMYNIIDFGTTDQEVSEAFYNWFVANANPYSYVDEGIKEIIGTWYFKDIVDLSKKFAFGARIGKTIGFVDDTSALSTLRVCTKSSQLALWFGWSAGGYSGASDTNGVISKYKSITFNDYAAQIADEAFMTWLKANATKLSDEEQPTEPAKKFKRLYIGDVVASSDSKRFNVLGTHISENHLTFSSPSAFTISVESNEKSWDGVLEYSTDRIAWRVWSGTSAITSSADGKLYLRGTGNTYITGSRASSSARWRLDGSNISVSGNIENLLDYATVSIGKHPTMAAYCYIFMFNGCASLVTAPELPATSLTDHCYYSMFDGCTSLITPPELPATRLAASCYGSMFSRCTSLITPPALPATSLADDCYRSMFGDCISLTTSPKLPATSLTRNCYNSMFYNCKSLTSLPKLPATKLVYYCYEIMFVYCTNIKISTTKTGGYQTPYIISHNGSTTETKHYLYNMFGETGGTFKGSPLPNTTYYTSNTVV